MTTGPRPRPEVLKISAYVAGEAKLPGVNRIYKLSSNEGPFGPPPGAQEANVATANAAPKAVDRIRPALLCPRPKGPKGCFRHNRAALTIAYFSPCLKLRLGIRG